MFSVPVSDIHRVRWGSWWQLRGRVRVDIAEGTRVFVFSNPLSPGGIGIAEQAGAHVPATRWYEALTGLVQTPG